jgi:glucan phosphoethanolaminetransferase (alkaline phosphatase superfamily)
MTYKYITQETIDSGGKNIKSPEEFQEARIYNMEAVKNYNKRHKVHAVFNIWIIVQYVMLFFAVFILLAGQSQVDKSISTKELNWRFAIGVVGYVAYLILVTWFVFIKHCRDRLVLCLVSLPAALISLVFFIFPVGNFAAGWYYQKTEDELSKELGYPSFQRLNVTTVNTNADNLSELTYDSIREKINRDHPHDGTFL